MAETTVQLTEAQLRDLIADTVRETLMGIGVDVGEPLVMQKDFAHLRSWRESTEEIKKKGFGTLVAILVTGAAGAIWMAVKNGGGH